MASSYGLVDVSYFNKLFGMERRGMNNVYQKLLIALMAISAVLGFNSCRKSVRDIGQMEEKAKDKVVLAYVFVENNLVQPEQIAAQKLTHINYAFADIQNGVIKKGFESDEQNFALLNSLKKENLHLKILISVGGWTWSGNFSDTALTEESRNKFAKSAVEFVRKYKLDGIDIDWEYPGLPGIGNPHRPEDKENFTLLLKALREELDRYQVEDNKHYLTTVAAGAADEFIEATEMGEVAKYLDFVNLMTYDFYVAEADPITGHHTCLYTNPEAPKDISTHHAVQNFIRAGVPLDKIVIGSAFYGQAWGEVDSKNNGLFQPGKPAMINSSYKSIRTELEGNYGFKRYWDDIAKAPYLYSRSRRIFISYDDPVSVRLKCNYVIDHKLRGIMFWEYNGDYQNELLSIMAEMLLRK